ncbi:MAG: hypothetical protein IPJ85_08795 [Flavobacteriales bacterium]|nr:hypothetical protein [Flavobacteriales bacterium]
MNPITPWQRLARLLRLDKREIGHIYLYAFVGGAIGLSLPLGIQAIINLISGGQVATSWGVLIAFVTIGVGFTGVLQIMQMALAENIQQRLFARSALEFAYRLPRIRFDAAQGRYLPEVVNRFFDTTTVQKSLSKLLLDIPFAAADRAIIILLAPIIPASSRLRLAAPLVAAGASSSVSPGSVAWPPASRRAPTSTRLPTGSKNSVAVRTPLRWSVARTCRSCVLMSSWAATCMRARHTSKCS